MIEFLRSLPPWIVVFLGLGAGWGLVQLGNYFAWRRRLKESTEREFRKMEFCNLCGRPVEMNPTRELIRNRHKVVFCDGCVPSPVASQMAEVSAAVDALKPCGMCESCNAELWDRKDGTKHVQAGHKVWWNDDPDAPPSLHTAYSRPGS